MWLRGALDTNTLARLDSVGETAAAGARVSSTNALQSILGAGGPVSKALQPLLSDAFPTRVVTFDKTPETNWGVPWHQDRVIAVQNKANVSGFTNWSTKAGRLHCEPPHGILDRMLFIRLHLDDETVDGGPMQIALGSHHYGSVRASEAAGIAQNYEIETCLGQRGDILVLKMLTLHRSSQATVATSRRVLRVDYANGHLPAPLEWGFTPA